MTGLPRGVDSGVAGSPPPDRLLTPTAGRGVNGQPIQTGEGRRRGKRGDGDQLTAAGQTVDTDGRGQSALDTGQGRRGGPERQPAAGRLNTRMKLKMEI